MRQAGEQAAKRCSRCRAWLPRDAFASNRAMRDGLQAYCRACSAAYYADRQRAMGRIVRERVEVPDGHKFCPGCREVKPHSQWDRNRTSSDGWSAYCKACRAVDGRRRYFRKSYGLSETEVTALLEQFPVCPICRINEPKHVDHDHVSGRVRGILCFTCNAALGQLRDDPEIIRRAADYVEGATTLKGVA